MTTTSGGLPLMAQTQNSRYLTYNELAWALNVLQAGVISRSETAPPGSPAVGDAYIVDATATGAWAGHEDDIAFFFGGIWNFLEPEVAQGNGIFVQDESPTRVRWNGSAFEVLTLGDAGSTPYSPANQGDWGSPTPDDVAQALDQLADTIAESGSNAFGTVSVSGQTDVVADQPNDTLTLVAGSNVTLTTSAAGDSVTIAASSGGGGAVVQVKNTQTGAMATGSTAIPHDDTIPQNTEGNEVMTLAVTPTSATNKLKIEVVAFASVDVASRWLIGALFQDSSANAIAAGQTFNDTATAGVAMTFTHYMTAGTTSATTFKVRLGSSGADQITFNGQNGARRLGGVMASSITITEIVP